MQDRGVSLLSVLVPAFDEEPTIGELIDRVAALDLRPTRVEIIAVDDGSTDGTARVLEEARSRTPTLRVLRHAVNRGKGAAVRTALAAAEGDAVIIQDADLEYDPRDFAALLEALRSTGADAVFGTRYGSPSGRRRLVPYPNQMALNFYGAWALTGLTNALYGLELTDQATCYKLVRTSVLRSLDLGADRFELCSEMIAKLARGGHSIQEVPISFQPRSEGKKLRLRDGIGAVRMLVGQRG